MFPASDTDQITEERVESLSQTGDLSVIATKDQAGSGDRGRPITSKFSAFFLYQIRLRSVVFLVK